MAGGEEWVQFEPGHRKRVLSLSPQDPRMVGNGTSGIETVATMPRTSTRVPVFVALHKDSLNLATDHYRTLVWKCVPSRCRGYAPAAGQVDQRMANKAVVARAGPNQ